MLKYSVRRLLQSIPTMIAVIVAMFVLLELAPGNPIQAIVGDVPLSEELVQQTTQKYGLDKPLPERFLRYGQNLLRGDLGTSYATGRPVRVMILERIPATIFLTFSGLGFAAIVGTAAGVVAGATRRRSADLFVSTVSLAGYAIPVFWLGQLLVLFVSLRLGWLPAGGMGSARTNLTGFSRVLEIMTYGVLPMLTLSMRELSLNMRVTRTSMVEALTANYVLTARSKGASDRRTVWRHCFRNALVPTLSVVGYGFGFVLSGSILVETIFGWPGMGQLFYQSIGRRDNAVVLGIFLTISITVVIANTVTDLLYGLIDPRVRSR